MALRVQLPVLVQDAAGNAVSGASVDIVNRQTNQPPTVYTTETGGATRTLPLTTGANGRPPESWVVEAGYKVTQSAPAIGSDEFTWDAISARAGVGFVAYVEAGQVAGVLNTWVDLSTVGPQITIPTAGNYIATFSCEVSMVPAAGRTAQVAYAINGDEPTASRRAIRTTGVDGSVQEVTTIGATHVLPNVPANADVRLRYRASGAGIGFGVRRLHIRPLRES